MLCGTECCGCGACNNICPTHAIEMKYDSEGFIYPIVDDAKCVHCNRCKDVCPILGERTMNNTPEVIAAYCKDSSLRYYSSSGGVFPVLANNILSKGGVVCGAYFDSTDQKAKHIIIRQESDLKLLQGSKYIQSEIGDVFNSVKGILDRNGIVLFSGTSCQVAGLKKFLNKDYEKLYCVELICHGVPSSLLWKKYVESAEKKERKRIKNISFRDKKYCWGKQKRIYSIDYSNKMFQFSFENPYFRLFNSNLCLRPSCYKCRFKGLYSKSDISLGDFWNVNKIDESLDDGKGLSLVLIETKKGKELFENVNKQLFICRDKIEYKLACECNSAINKSMNESLQRENFFYDLRKMNFEQISKKYSPSGLKVFIKGNLLRLKKIFSFRKNTNSEFGICVEFEEINKKLHQ